MLITAKVFTNGHSQAIRLPKAFRVEVEEMWIARNEVTGEITLRPKDTVELRRKRLDQLMAAIAENPCQTVFYRMPAAKTTHRRTLLQTGKIALKKFSQSAQ